MNMRNSLGKSKFFTKHYFLVFNHFLTSIFPYSSNRVLQLDGVLRKYLYLFWWLLFEFSTSSILTRHFHKSLAVLVKMIITILIIWIISCNEFNCAPEIWSYINIYTCCNNGSFLAIPSTISCVTMSVRKCLLVKQVKWIARVSQAHMG